VVFHKIEKAQASLVSDVVPYLARKWQWRFTRISDIADY
jgi:hypothetical protein